MFDTERNQPMRVCASASPFSQRRLGISNGTSTRTPCRARPAARAFGSGTKIDRMVGATLRCRHATTLPLRVEPGIDAFGGDGVIVVVLEVVLARPDDLDRGAAHLRDSNAASSTKSHFDLRPKPPPSNVTLTVTSSGLRPSFLASSSRVPPGLCTARPDLAFAVGDAHRCAWRLHRRMREMRDVVFRRTPSWRPTPSAFSASPSLRTTLPGLRAVSSICAL